MTEIEKLRHWTQDKMEEVDKQIKKEYDKPIEERSVVLIWSWQGQWAAYASVYHRTVNGVTDTQPAQD